jgi:hypothetical protein
MNTKTTSTDHNRTNYVVEFLGNRHMTISYQNENKEILILRTDNGKIIELIERDKLSDFLYSIIDDSVLLNDDLISKCINFDRNRKLKNIL